MPTTSVGMAPKDFPCFPKKIETPSQPCWASLSRRSVSRSNEGFGGLSAAHAKITWLSSWPLSSWPLSSRPSSRASSQLSSQLSSWPPSRPPNALWRSSLAPGAGADRRQILRPKTRQRTFIPPAAEGSTIFRQTEKRVALRATRRIRLLVHDAPSTATIGRSSPDLVSKPLPSQEASASWGLSCFRGRSCDEFFPEENFASLPTSCTNRPQLYMILTIFNFISSTILDFFRKFFSFGMNSGPSMKREKLRERRAR
jgi:hypothetical protein